MTAFYRNQSRNIGWNFNSSEMRFFFGTAVVCLQQYSKVQADIRDVRKRVAGIDRQRRQDRIYPVGEKLFELLLLGSRQVIEFDQLNSEFAKTGQNLV